MCLLGIARDAHARYALIIAGNRDEYHWRPTAGADWWPDAGHVFGGRDLLAGGSWLGVSRDGRIAVVTNHPGRPHASRNAASRGQLVRDFLTGATPARQFIAQVQKAAHRYAGFCLIAGTAGELHGAVSPPGAHPTPWLVPEGVWAISNSPIEAPLPKAAYLEARLEDLLAEPEVRTEDLFAILARREPVGEPDAGESARAWVRRTPFVVGSDFGTRASTVVLIGRDGECRITERRFDAGGLFAGESSARFVFEE